MRLRDIAFHFGNAFLNVILSEGGRMPKPKDPTDLKWLFLLQGFLVSF